jgi:hypothetical protein
MSAYDNPTIIKDDTAMAWAQAASGFAPSFSESFNIARKNKEAKDKEAKLDAERRAKESEQLLINIQRTNADIQNANAADAARTFSELPKQFDTSLTTQFGNSVQEFGKMFGDAAVKNETTVVGEDVKSVLAKKPIYLQTRQNVISSFGGIKSQVDSYQEDFKGDGSDVSIIGTNPVERMTNFYTLQGLNPKNAISSNVTKSFEWNKEDPSKASLKVSTKFNSKAELIQALGKWTPGSKPEDLEKMISDAGKSITSNEDGSYSVNFEKQLGDGSWDGMFYTKVPPTITGDEFKNANIVDEKNNLSPKYLGNTTNIAAKGYDSKKQGYKGYWQGTEINMKNVEDDLRPVVQARMEGLLNADFRDLNVLQGFLTNKLKLGTDEVAMFLNKQTYEDKVKFLTDRTMKLEIAKNIGNQLNEVDGKYYLGDAQRIQDIGESTSKSGGPTATQKEKASTWQRQREDIKNMEIGGTGDFKYGDRRVSYDGSQFIIQTAGANKDIPIRTKKQVIDYLETGSYK